MKVAAIIKHTFRDFDYRVDIYEIDSEDHMPSLEKKIKRGLLAHFELIALTLKVDDKSANRPQE